MESVRAVGTMSGTSLDGVDAAEIWTDGDTISQFGGTAYRAYDGAERETIRRALGRWPGEAGVAEAAEIVEAAHVDLLRGFDADLIGFHGQTLAHDPGGRRTHQTGDGTVLARALGLPVIWDFRSADMAAGGQGAPLAPAFHHACARWARETRPVAFLNLGGVGNLTWVDPDRDMDATGALLAFDTGPANAPIDDLCAARSDRAFDADGVLARSGTADTALAAEFMDHPFFSRYPPKSLDRNDFARAGAAIDALSLRDAVATWVAVISASVRKGLDLMPSSPARLLVTGGGRRNPAIMAALVDASLCPVEPVEAAGLDGDMLEAQAFAYLAVRVRRGLPISFPGTTGVVAPQRGGRISEGPAAVDSPGADARQDGGGLGPSRH